LKNFDLIQNYITLRAEAKPQTAIDAYNDIYL